ncbi:hypothetical protein [Stenotrophomonas sp. Marseille-Q5258]|uniref:hypothetical protein n=1 Tax=Stenotrophomonas sp. Marseille-Q5258 TaxID=2972779 RepID=UPI0021C61F39|nr:hypothetical protein [Stenotrophomonas sp. Marseille-Q5258]
MGIIDGRPLGLAAEDAAQARLESDVIFGCVFLGFVHDALRQGVVLCWDVDPADPPAQVEQGIQALQAVLERLVALTGIHTDTVRVGQSPRYEPARRQIAIAAVSRPHGDDAARQARRQIQWTPEVEQRITELLDNDPLMEQNLDAEFGAYYGIVDHPDNTNPLVISSVRRLIPYADEGGRWNRRVPGHGLIHYDDPAWTLEQARQLPKQAGSTETAARIATWDGSGHVCGYCHGMVWAVAQVRCNFPDGRPFELGLGRNTHKLASCFGCSTFLHANGLAPSSMHLGRSDSWVPLPEGEDGVAVFNLGLGNEARHPGIVAGLNAAWATHVAGWLVAGTRIAAQDTARVPAEVRAVARTLQREAIARGRDTRAVANLFLDALTVHQKDLHRLMRFVG